MPIILYGMQIPLICRQTFECTVQRIVCRRFFLAKPATSLDWDNMTSRVPPPTRSTVVRI